MAKGKKVEVVDGESKGDKWLRLARKRTAKAVAAIKAIGPLGNTSQYEYTEEQRVKLHDALENAVVEMELVFDNNGKAGATADLF